MPKTVRALTPEAVAEIRKSLTAAAGKDTALLAKVEEEIKKLEGLDELEVVEKTDEDNADGGGNEDAGGDGDAPNPVADVVVAMGDALEKVLKAKTGDKVAGMQAVLENGYATLAKIYDEAAELNYTAGMAQVGKAHNDSPAGKGKRAAAKPKNSADQPSDNDGEDADMGEGLQKVLKGASPAVQALFKRMNDRTTALQTQVTELVDQRDKDRFEKIARDAGEGVEFAALLREVAKTSPKHAETIAKQVKSKNEAIRKGGLFQEVGGAGDAGSSTALEQLNAKATEYLSKNAKDAAGRPNTLAKSFKAACEQNPDLYREYKVELYGPRA